MQQSNCKNITEYCNELEVLSSKMAEFFSIGNYNEINNIDIKRKNILKEISKDVSKLSKKNKKTLKLVWENNKAIIDQTEKNIIANRKNFIKKKKLFLAYKEN
tara:strand:+ start:128 stop:436 length:309 start_codon:yes stop_codon:yes gene_type:complete